MAFNIEKSLEKYSIEDLISIIKIFINNPILDLLNCVYLKDQGFCENERIVKKEDNSEKSYNIIYMENTGEMKIYEFSSESIEKTAIELDYMKLSNKYYKSIGYKVLINRDIDDDKKSYVITDNILYLSDYENEHTRCINILKSFVEQKAIKNNNLFDHQLCKSIVDFYIDNKPIEIQQSILKQSYISKAYLLNMNFRYFQDLLRTFFYQFIELNDYMYLINNETTNINIDKKYNNAFIEGLLINIKNDNINDFPYYSVDIK